MSRDIIYLVIGSSYGRMAQLVVPTGTFSRMRDVDVNRLLASRSLESTEGSPKNPNILGEIVRIVRIRSHGSVGRAYWLMYITTSALPGSASGSTKFRGLPHLPLEESVDRPAMKIANRFSQFHYGRMAQLVEHIVHIDGVTGSSPVATTTKPRRHKAFEVFSVSWTSALLPVGGPDRHTISFYQLRSFTNIQNFECAVSFSMLTGWSPISFTRVDVNGSPASM